MLFASGDSNIVGVQEAPVPQLLMEFSQIVAGLRIYLVHKNGMPEPKFKSLLKTAFEQGMDAIVEKMAGNTTIKKDAFDEEEFSKFVDNFDVDEFLKKLNEREGK
jgi:hypothetical protein